MNVALVAFGVSFFTSLATSAFWMWFDWKKQNDFDALIHEKDKLIVKLRDALHATQKQEKAK